ncbi:MAG: hypothetical protein A2937_01510 [Candidatus Yonathbacteria bacterium RIFCSPLOWO2_01_FULL_47_33b]|uniref:Uncharacterized protein n=1 Tax=Candidatus Yonathbacteria bacterium RIFCSPLOWO2_01_FULL_47_33b TaxID=1802727 RepID=A0A1G2SI17_9BACT|nr:MAG: hypothetical protein A2937_01510 [Candidatus Yonathbacteria bacterium RIFCSPLOWO2_01_FULL_47_33b]
MGNQSQGPQDPEFQKHHEEQMSEIFSDFNRRVAREAFGREPTDDELIMHYIDNEGAKNLAIKNGRDVIGADL